MFTGMHYVYEVYKTQSFSKAAQNLYISQPSLSAMIKKIENKVGAPLFDRSVTPVQLTEYGKKYIKTAEKIMDLEDEFSYYTDNLNELKTGHLSIGATSFFASFIAPKFLSAFSAAYPHIKINFFEGHSNILEEKAATGELDLVIDNYQTDSSLYTHHTLMEEHLLLAVPKSFSSNRRVARYQLTWEDICNRVHLNPSIPGVSLRKFAEEPFITLRLPNDTRKRTETIFQDEGMKLAPYLKLDQLLTVYHLTEYGMGMSFVSDTIVRHLPPSQNIIYYKCDHPDAIRNVTLYHKKTRYLTRSMKEFIRITCQD